MFHNARNGVLKRRFGHKVTEYTKTATQNLNTKYISYDPNYHF